MPNLSPWLLVSLLLLGCRSSEPNDAELEQAPDQPPVPTIETRPWGFDAEPPPAIELPADLAVLTYDPNAQPASPGSIPFWTISVVDPGEGFRPLVYRPAKIARRIRYLLGDVGTERTRLTTTLYWWSFAPTAGSNAVDLGFAGSDCVRGAAEGEVEAMKAALAASAKQASAACAALRGQGRADGSRLSQIGQTAGVTMTPPVPEIIELFAVPLPSEPVGIGASWTAKYATERMTSTRTYTLVGIDGAELDIAFAAKTTFHDQPDEDAKGTLAVSLFDPLARSGKIEVITRVRFPGSEPGDPPDEFPLRLELSTLAAE